MKFSPPPRFVAFASGVSAPLTVLLIDNGLYEVTGGQDVAGAGRTDFAADASGTIEDARAALLEGELNLLLPGGRERQDERPQQEPGQQEASDPGDSATHRRIARGTAPLSCWNSSFSKWTPWSLIRSRNLGRRPVGWMMPRKRPFSSMPAR